MSFPRKFLRITGLFTLSCFLLQQAAQGAESLPKPIHSPQIEVPADLGTLDKILSADSGKKIFHIQDAHGSEDAQQNIRLLLKHITDQYGVKSVALEGGSGKLQPKQLVFFPDQPGQNIKIAEALLKKAELSGAELFLLEDLQNPEAGKINAYGVENIPDYRDNRFTFQEVLRAKNKTDIFLAQMDEKIKRLTAPLLNESLKSFLKKEEDHQSGFLSLSTWLEFLQKEAKKDLSLDLENAFNQSSWPMLLRFFRLQKNSREIIPSSVANEKDAFIKMLRQSNIEKPVLEKAIALLDHNGTSAAENFSQFPYDEGLRTLGELLEKLPEHFTFKPYRNLQLSLQSRILQSELSASEVYSELQKLENLLLNHLTRTEDEKKLVALYKNYLQLKKLFRLEVTRNEYQNILKKKASFEPAAMILAFDKLSASPKTRPVSFEHAEEIHRLFELALEFYAGAIQRDQSMGQNILNLLDKTGGDLVLITGGFHSEGLEKFFKQEGINYYQISPRIQNLAGTKTYQAAMLEENMPESKESTPLQTSIPSSNIAKILKINPPQTMGALAGDKLYPNRVRQLIRSQIAGLKLPRPKSKTPAPESTTRSETRSLPSPILLSEAKVTDIKERVKFAGIPDDKIQQITNLLFALRAQITSLSGLYGFLLQQSILKSNPEAIERIASLFELQATGFKNERDVFNYHFRKALPSSSSWNFRNYLNKNPEIKNRWLDTPDLKARLNIAEQYARSNASVTRFRSLLATIGVHFSDQYRTSAVLYFDQVANFGTRIIDPIKTTEDEVKAIDMFIAIDEILRKNARLKTILQSVSAEKIEWAIAKRNIYQGNSEVSVYTAELAPGTTRRFLIIPTEIDYKNEPINYHQPAPGSLSISTPGKSFSVLERVLSHEIAHLYLHRAPEAAGISFTAPINVKRLKELVKTNASLLNLPPIQDHENPYAFIPTIFNAIYAHKASLIRTQFPKYSTAEIFYNFDELHTQFLTPHSAASPEEYWSEALSLFWLDPDWVKSKDPLTYEFLTAVRNWDETAPEPSSSRSELRTSKNQADSFFAKLEETLNKLPGDFKKYDFDYSFISEGAVEEHLGQGMNLVMDIFRSRGFMVNQETETLTTYWIDPDSNTFTFSELLNLIKRKIQVVEGIYEDQDLDAAIGLILKTQGIPYKKTSVVTLDNLLVWQELTEFASQLDNQPRSEVRGIRQTLIRLGGSLAVALAMSLGSEIAAQVKTRLNPADDPIVKVAKKAMPSVALISVGQEKQKNTGSGAVVYSDPKTYTLIITNSHVVQKAKKVTVSFKDGTTYEGEVVRNEPLKDLAAVSIKTSKQFPVLPFQQRPVFPGQTVVALGHPFGYSFTVSAGIVSGKGRDITLPGEITLKGLLQTDAAINPGNSGGPLLNINGELVGINSAVRTGAQNIGFTISSDEVSRFATGLLPTSLPVLTRKQDAKVEIYDTLVEKIKNADASVVSIHTPRPGKKDLIGTGVILHSNEKESFIITPSHMLQGLDKTTPNILLTDGTLYNAEIINNDPKLDLALLKIVPGKKLPALEVADMPPNTGTSFFSIGSPYGYLSSVTMGRISHAAREDVQGLKFQLDLGVNPGDSGSPLIDSQTGKMLGMVTAKYDGATRLGFGIPGKAIKEFANIQELSSHTPSSKTSEKETPGKSDPVVNIVKEVHSGAVTLSTSGKISGSGTVIHIAPKKAIVVTTTHVLGETKNIDVILSNGEILEAKLLRSYPEKTLAFLEVSLKQNSKIKSLTWNNSEPLNGEPVIAIGAPLKFENTVSVGVISANRKLGLQDFYQTTAAINTGNGGGPLINFNGELVGVNALLHGTSGIAFAIPAKEIKELYDRDLLKQSTAPIFNFNLLPFAPEPRFREPAPVIITPSTPGGIQIADPKTVLPRSEVRSEEQRYASFVANALGAAGWALTLGKVTASKKQQAVIEEISKEISEAHELFYHPHKISNYSAEDILAQLEIINEAESRLISFQKQKPGGLWSLLLSIFSWFFPEERSSPENLQETDKKIAEALDELANAKVYVDKILSFPRSEVRNEPLPENWVYREPTAEDQPSKGALFKRYFEHETPQKTFFELKWKLFSRVLLDANGRLLAAYEVYMTPKSLQIEGEDLKALALKGYFAVDPALKGQKIGSRFFERIKQEFRSQGYDVLIGESILSEREPFWAYLGGKQPPTNQTYEYSIGKSTYVRLIFDLRDIEPLPLKAETTAIFPGGQNNLLQAEVLKQIVNLIASDTLNQILTTSISVEEMIQRMPNGVSTGLLAYSLSTPESIAKINYPAARKILSTPDFLKTLKMNRALFTQAALLYFQTPKFAGLLESRSNVPGANKPRYQDWELTKEEATKLLNQVSSRSEIRSAAPLPEKDMGADAGSLLLSYKIAARKALKSIPWIVGIGAVALLVDLMTKSIAFSMVDGPIGYSSTPDYRVSLQQKEIMGITMTKIIHVARVSSFSLAVLKIIEMAFITPFLFITLLFVNKPDLPESFKNSQLLKYTAYAGIISYGIFLGTLGNNVDILTLGGARDWIVRSDGTANIADFALWLFKDLSAVTVGILFTFSFLNPLYKAKSLSVILAQVKKSVLFTILSFGIVLSLTLFLSSKIERSPEDFVPETPPQTYVRPLMDSNDEIYITAFHHLKKQPSATQLEVAGLLISERAKNKSSDAYVDHTIRFLMKRNAEKLPQWTQKLLDHSDPEVRRKTIEHLRGQSFPIQETVIPFIVEQGLKDSDQSVVTESAFLLRTFARDNPGKLQPFQKKIEAILKNPSLPPVTEMHLIWILELINKTPRSEMRVEINKDDARHPSWQKTMAEEDLNAAPEVLKSYSIGEIKSIVPLQAGIGEHGKALKVESSQGTYILKPITTALYPDLIEGARYEVSVVNELVRKKFPTAPLVETKKAKTTSFEDGYFVQADNGKIYLLYQFVGGGNIPQEAMGTGQFNSFVDSLARLHKELSNFKPAGKRSRPSIIDFESQKERIQQLKALLEQKKKDNPKHDFSRGEKFFLNHADFILEQLSVLNLNLPPPDYQDLPQTIIHGDYHPGNVLFRDTQVTAVLDWDHLRRETRLYDLLNGVIPNITPDNKFNTSELMLAITRYEATQTLTPNERKFLPEIVRLKFLDLATWIVRPEKISERFQYDLSATPPLEQVITILDRNEHVYDWFQKNMLVLKDIDLQISQNKFSTPVREAILGDSSMDSITKEKMDEFEKLEAFIRKDNALGALYDILTSFQRELFETRNPKALWTIAHAMRTAIIAFQVGQHMQLPEPELRALTFAMVIHDIGKVYTSSDILNSGDPLTSSQFSEIKKHVTSGAKVFDEILDTIRSHVKSDSTDPDIDLLDFQTSLSQEKILSESDIPNLLKNPALDKTEFLKEALSQKEFLRNLKQIIFMHHETADGTGYLGHINKNLLAQISLISDIHDAVMMKRPYKDALPLSSVAEILLAGRGTKFLDSVVEAWFKVFGPALSASDNTPARAEVRSATVQELKLPNNSQIRTALNAENSGIRDLFYNVRVFQDEEDETISVYRLEGFSVSAIVRVKATGTRVKQLTASPITLSRNFKDNRPPKANRELFRIFLKTFKESGFENVDLEYISPQDSQLEEVLKNLLLAGGIQESELTEFVRRGKHAFSQNYPHKIGVTLPLREIDFTQSLITRSEIRSEFAYTQEALTKVVEGKNWGVSVLERFAAPDAEGKPKPSEFYSLGGLIFPDSGSVVYKNLIQLQDEFQKLPFAGKFFRTPGASLHLSLFPVSELKPRNRPFAATEIDQARGIFLQKTGNLQLSELEVENLRTDTDSGRIQAEVTFTSSTGGERQKATITLLTPYQPLTEEERNGLSAWINSHKQDSFGKLLVTHIHFVYAKDSFAIDREMESFPLRSEIRTETSLTVSQVTRIAKTLLDGILPKNIGTQIFTAAFALLFSTQIAQASTAVAAAPLEFAQQKIAAAANAESVSAAALQSLLTPDPSFALVGVPVPTSLPRSELRKVLEELKPFLALHPKKLLALTYAGPLSQEEIEEIYQTSDQRVIIFQGFGEIFTDFYAGRFSKLGVENSKTAKRVLERSRELTKSSSTVVSLAPVSVVISNQGTFDTNLSLIGKQFVNTPVDGLSLAQRFMADVFYSVKAAGITAEKLTQDLNELTVLSLGTSVRFEFNESLSGRIADLVQAAMRVLSAA